MKFLMFTPPGSGQMIPHMNLTRELMARGDSVTWAMPKPALERLWKNGFDAVEAGPENLDFEHRDLYCPGHSESTGFAEFVLTADKLLMESTPKIVNDILAKFSRNDFDAIIADVCSPAAPILSQLWDMPWICVSTISLSYTSPAIPPYSFEDEFDAGEPLEVFHQGHNFIRDRYNEVRAQFNLPPVKSGWNDLFSPLLSLGVTTQELEYAEAVTPPGFVYVGPLSNLEPDPNLDSHFKEFIAAHPEKILYATLGTVFNKYSHLMEILIKGVYLSGQTTIISTGPGYKVSEELLAAKPDNVLIVSWANHRALFPYMTAAVTHGGMSTTCDTVGFALPTLHLPVGCDLPSLSRKIVRRKAGLRLPHSIATPELVAENIHQLMNTEEFYTNVAKLQHSFLNAGGAPRAIQLIKDAVNQRKTKATREESAELV